MRGTHFEPIAWRRERWVGCEHGEPLLATYAKYTRFVCDATLSCFTIGCCTSQSKCIAQSHAGLRGALGICPWTSRRGLRPDNLGAIVSKWAVLVRKTAVPTDVTQKTQTLSTAASLRSRVKKEPRAFSEFDLVCPRVGFVSDPIGGCVSLRFSLRICSLRRLRLLSIVFFFFFTESCPEGMS